MKRMLKIVPNKFDNENRDKRELSVVKELGCEVIVIAKGNVNGIKVIDGFDVHCRTTRPLGDNKLLLNINRVLSLITWACYARKIKPDYISGHDLTGIFIGWLSTLFLVKNKRPLLVYDSHEFELGRNTIKKRNKFTKWRISLMEKFLMSQSTFSVMVNNSISEEVKKIHGLSNEIVIVRNIPSFWDIDENICSEKRKEICNKLDIPESTYIVMYHGGISRGRGIENLIRANKHVNGSAVIILGYGEDEYIREIKELSMNNKMEERVFFLKAVPIEVLWQYIGAADVGAVTIENVSHSYYLSLPNKLFENIQSLTPVIASNFPEIQDIVEGYNIGLCCDPSDIDSIAYSINKLKDDKELYNKFRVNISKAKQELTWENEKKILREAYSGLFKLT